MGGKAIRRREKNYRAAHDGGNSTRLPPPPVASSIDALPSKLRKLMSLAGGAKQPLNYGKKNTGDGADKAAHLKEGTESSAKGMKRKRDNERLLAKLKELGDEAEFSKNGKNKKKRKGKKADDLRFKGLDTPAAGSKRKERKKKLLEAKKKKQQTAQTEEDMDFRGREEITFGDIVEAPPKLTALPKAFKAAASAQVASQERLRLQAVEAYRKRKGWESRPGVKLPPLATT